MTAPLRTARPTMRDVAERAGVSLKTVSRVINDEPGVAAGDGRARRGAIAELGFQRNDLARSLRHGRASSTLGLVIEDVANPFYSAIAPRVEAAAHDRGHMLITGLLRGGPRARARAGRARCCAGAVDALLLVPAGATTATCARDRRRHARRLPRPPADGRRRRHRAARQPRRRPRRGRAPARATATSGSPSRRPAAALHRRRAPRRLPRRARRRRRAGPRRAAPRSAPHDAAAAEAVVRELLAPPARPPARPRSSPPTTATRSARCARCATATAPSRSSASTTSSSPTCSCRSPSSATTRRDGRASPPSSRSTRLDGDERPPQRRVIVCTDSSPAAPGSVPAAMTPPPQLPPNPLRHFYRGGPRDRRAARHRRRRRPLARGVDRRGQRRSFGDDERGLSRLRTAPSSATRSPPTPRRASAPTTSRASARAPRCWSSSSTPASACPSTTTPTARSRSEHLGTRLRQDRGVARSRGRAAARGRTSASRADVELDEVCATGCDDAGPRRDARRAAPSCRSSAGDAIFVPAGTAARDRRGHPHRRAAGADRPLGPARVGRLRLDDEHDGHLGLGWDRALASARPRARRDRAAACAARRARRRSPQLLPERGRRPSSRAQRVAPGGGSARAARRLRGRPRHRGRGRRSPAST